jgi:hypothetical protein
VIRRSRPALAGFWAIMVGSSRAILWVAAMDNSGQAHRTRQNVIALVILALILLGGAWLFHDLKASSDVLDCLSSGRRDCGSSTSPVR